MSNPETPTCPRCNERPRGTAANGRTNPYCDPCAGDYQRERKGHSPALRPCERCGKQYRGNSRAKAQVCPDCRTSCITCGNPKSPGDATHNQCQDCRNAGRRCQTCGINPPFQNRRQCWACISAEGIYAAQARDRIYSLKPGQYDQMLADQNGVCAISNQLETSVNSRTGKVYPLAVDHDRACCPGDRSCGNCVRGLVRRNLNVALGMFNDDPELLRAAAAYIERHRQQAQHEAGARPSAGTDPG